MSGVDPRRSLITPEGIDLRVRLADIGTRFGALTIDLIIINVAMFLIALILFFTFGRMVKPGDGFGALGIGLSLFILINFFVRNFYFMAFEMGRKAATPGKRMMKIRVAPRGRARLSAASVFARNAMREIELFLPLSLMGGAATGLDGLVQGLALLWAMIFALFPLFNRDRLRIGDIIAGTWVVRAPKPVLLEDVASRSQLSSQKFIFTPAQISAYGVKELHTLETVLRDRQAAVMEDVAARIRRKIDYAEEINERDEDFLNAYYSALRGRLEGQLLMGVRRKDKHDIRGAARR